MIDPESDHLTGYLRRGDRLLPIPALHGFVSPRLGITFENLDGEFTFLRPDGSRFENYREVQKARRVAERLLFNSITDKKNDEVLIRKLRQKLIDAGIDPDA